MKFFRKIWLSLGKPARTMIRAAVRSEAQRLLDEKVMPIVIEKVTDRHPASGIRLSHDIQTEIEKQLRK